RVHRTGNDDYMTAVIFVPLAPRTRKLFFPEFGFVRERHGVQALHGRVGNSNVGHSHSSTIVAARRQQMPRLAATECYGLGRLYGSAANLSSPSVNSARQVHSDRRLAAGIDCLDSRACLAVEIAREPRAEQRVDDN